jgi:pSer/pThr/pTyr-binding forkhead associated (FHA) protein
MNMYAYLFTGAEIISRRHAEVIMTRIEGVFDFELRDLAALNGTVCID